MNYKNNFTTLPAILLLADDTVFYGKAAGKIGMTTGEICFNTGMTGYQEVFTDPSYCGQILVATHVHIGNYGIHPHESESEHIQIAGLVCKNYTLAYSRRQAHRSVQSYFQQEHIVAISDVDTRALVQHLRNKGTMNALISSDLFDISILKKILSKVPSMSGLELSSKVSTKTPYYFGHASNPYRVAVLDLGIKKSILSNLAKRQVYAKIFPARTSFDEMEAWRPHGYLISNGPGDPLVMTYAVETIQKILAADKALFGICLGHQLLALANGIPTEKLFNGHRGLNHPVKNILTNRCEVTSQNHGFGVVTDAVRQSDRVIITHVNLNDQSIEGIRVKGKKAFSIQYHPEAAPGPQDAHYLFDDFVRMLHTPA